MRRLFAFHQNAGAQTKQTLTGGQKNAVKEAEGMEKGTVAIYDNDGKIQSEKHVSEATLPATLEEYVKSKCEDPRPISPLCVVCADGKIICAKVNKWAKMDIPVLIFTPVAMTQSSGESLLTTDNAYNPIPSPDGNYIGYVRTGWGEGMFASLGRSSLISDVKIMDAKGGATSRTLVKGFFQSGWTPDSTRLVCYRDWKYALVSTEGKESLAGRIPNDPNYFEVAAEWVAFSPSLETIVWSRRIKKSYGAIETPNRLVVRHAMSWQERVVPSPDGRYLAVFHEGWFDLELRVYDLCWFSRKWREGAFR
jgi:hypothetical protein